MNNPKKKKIKKRRHMSDIYKKSTKASAHYKQGIAKAFSNVFKNEGFSGNRIKKKGNKM